MIVQHIGVKDLSAERRNPCIVFMTDQRRVLATLTTEFRTDWDYTLGQWKTEPAIPPHAVERIAKYLEQTLEGLEL